MEQILTLILDNLVETLSIAALAGLNAALVALYKWLSGKYKIEVSSETRYELDALAHDAVNYAEEVARGTLKTIITTLDQSAKPEKVTNTQKEELAVTFLLESAKKHNLTPERARKLVLAALGSTRK